MKIDKYSAILGNTVGFHDMDGLTEHRPIATLPFGGKYRLIDFPLSNLANAGIRSVFGIFQNENISSVFDHIRSGREWGLSTLLSHYYLGIYNTPVESSTLILTKFSPSTIQQNKKLLWSTKNFLKNSFQM